MGGQRRADETGSAPDQTRGLWDLPPAAQWEQKILRTNLENTEKSMFYQGLLQTKRLMIPHVMSVFTRAVSPLSDINS